MGRGFLIAVLVAFGIPGLSVILALSSPGFAMVFAYTLAPLMVYAFPVVLFVPDAGVGGLLASVLLLSALCLATAWFGRRQAAGIQMVLIIVVMLVWCGAWWAIAQATGVKPAFDVHM